MNSIHLDSARGGSSAGIMNANEQPSTSTPSPSRPQLSTNSRQLSDTPPSIRRPSRRHRHSEGDVPGAVRPVARTSLNGTRPLDLGNPGYQTLQEFLQQLDEDDDRQARRPRRLHALSESARRPGPYHPSQYSPSIRSSRVTGLRSPRSPTAFNPPPLPLAEDEGSMAHPGSRVSQSTYVKPRWQADAEVSECPICGRPFGFFFRKHHCRKCGRVVCAHCSPHWITIPRQFIVDPPGEDSDGGEAQGEVLDMRAENDAGTSLEGSAVFGGQEVRLCNPCVPDPQPLPPPEYSSPPTTARDVLTTFPPDVDGRGTRYPVRTSSQNRDWVDAYIPELQRQRSSTDPHRLGLRPPAGPRLSQDDRPAVTAGVHRMSLPPPHPDHAPNLRLSRHGHRSGHSVGMIPTAQIDTNAPLPPVPRPVRRIAEEDECPICHDELPPKGPDGDESDRESHIASCIEESLGGGARSVPASNSSTPSALTQSSSVPTQQAPPTSAAGPSRPSRQRAETQTDPSAQYAGWRRSNMLVFKATEKECVDAEGRTKECVICLDDFVEGDEMGRLECWCTFHRKCIRSWWDQKGVGACPLHQYQEEA